VALIALPQAGGGPFKLRPALVLATLPGPYQNVLLCGISTQMHALVANWDEVIDASHADFGASGLKHASIIRLSFLYAADPNEIIGVIGAVDAARRDRLLARLSNHLQP
jgi:mRNA interferase MazF